MLSARDRRVLAQLERSLADTSPELVALFRGGASADRGAYATSRYVLVAGLLLIAVGAVALTWALALFGIVLTLFAPLLAAAGSVPAGPDR